MSAQFGVWHFDGKRPDQGLIAKAGLRIAPYGPDAGNSLVKKPLAMLYGAFQTTNESCLEEQPCVSSKGNVLTWDGRLDNREELFVMLGEEINHTATDVEIVMAAFEQWGANCFRKLIGDWALALWDAGGQALLLAKDFVGVRHLYYSLTPGCITWSTALEPLVHLAGRPFSLNEEWIAGYFADYPPCHLTPYEGIRSVRAGTWLTVKEARATERSYWSLDHVKPIRYQADAEYEAHFRSVFGESVRRRLRANSPVLAELSGGLDSSSIVCMADWLIEQGKAQAERLDTISYYDDEEPNWDDQLYFPAVEKQRGRQGCHIEMKRRNFLCQPVDPEYFPSLPGIDQGGIDFETRRVACAQSNGNRVLLSGVGGDEFLGGVPTPIPELADLVVERRFAQLAHQLKSWSLVKKQPWTHLLLDTLRSFLPSTIPLVLKKKSIPSWFSPQFIRRHRVVFLRSEPRINARGSLPSQQFTVHTLEVMRRQLGSTRPIFPGCYELRYPYLDQDLLEFLYAIPRDQVIRPGRRRSLMRRALVGLVPDEILNRRRKAFVSRGPMSALESARPRIDELCRTMTRRVLGFVDEQRFADELQKARHGRVESLLHLLTALKLLLWVQDLLSRGILCDGAAQTHLASRRVLLKEAGDRGAAFQSQRG